MPGLFDILFSNLTVTTIVVIDILMLLGVSVYFVIKVRDATLQSDKAIRDVEHISAEAAKDYIRGMQAAQSAESAHAREAWAEYRKTLFQTEDARGVYSTDDAERFFNTRTLASGLFRNSFIAAIPSMLTAIGVLATFVGLTIGLSGVNISAEADADSLMEGISTLISSAGASFVTSVAGVISSLAATGLLKSREHRVQQKIATLEAEVDNRFTRYSAESGLYSMDRNTRESAEALAQLHEKIGAQLQTAVNGLSQEMQSAFVTAIDHALAPAMQQLTADTSKQSSEIFETLINQFSGAFEQLGTTQATAMRSASDGLVRSVSTLSDEVGQSISALKSSADEDRAANREALESMRTTALSQVEEIQSATAAQVEEMRRASREQAETERAAAAALMEELRTANTEQLKSFRNETAEQTHVLQSQLSDLSSLAEKQQESSSKTIDQLTTLAEETRASMAAASTHLTESSAHLKSVAADFSTASREASAQLAESTASIDEVSTRQQRSLEALDRHSASIDRLSHLSGSTAERLSGAADEAKTTFELMQLHQNEFVTNMESALNRAQAQLVSEIEKVSQAMSTWLNQYSDDVRSQTNARMDEWNTQTTSFASSLLDTSRALSEVVDELERKTTNGVAPQPVR